MRLIDPKTITAEKLKALRYSKNDIVGKEYQNIIVIPTNEIHDSGFLCMKYILLTHECELVGVVGGYSDVLHLWNGKASIDCLPCGYLRVMLDNPAKVPDFIGSDLFVSDGLINSFLSTPTKWNEVFEMLYDIVCRGEKEDETH